MRAPVLASCCAALMVSACHGQQTMPVALSDADTTAIKQDIVQVLAGRQYMSQYGTPANCTNLFRLGEVKILDVSLAEQTGKVRVEVPVTSSGNVGFGSIAADNCFGSPPNGWVPGRLSTSRYELSIAKWQSGWRLTQPQSFDLVK